MTAVNHLTTYAMKGVLRQMPTVGRAQLVTRSDPSGLSTYTELGAYPGVPELSSDVSSLFLQAVGTIPSDQTPITIQTLRGGMVGLGEASFIWSQAIDRDVINTGAGKGSLDTNRGWEWPSYVTHYEPVVWGGSGAARTSQLDCCTLPDGRVYQVYVSLDSGTSVEVLLQVRELDGTWSEGPDPIYSSPDTSRFALSPCLVPMPDGRVLCYLVDYEVSGTDLQIQCKVIYPDDLSVEAYEAACIKTTLLVDDYGAPDEGSHLRGAMKPDGSVVLFLVTWDGVDEFYRLLQLGSYDYGHSFTVVDYDTDSWTGVRYPDVVYVDGAFIVSYVQQDVSVGVGATRDTVIVKALSHFYDAITDASERATFVLSADNGDQSYAFGNALVATPDNQLFAVNSVGDDGSPTTLYAVIHQSPDLGKTWTDSDDDDQPNVGYDTSSIGPSWLYFTETGVQTLCARLEGLCATVQGNRVYVGSLYVQDSETTDTHDEGSLLAFYLGGWSNQQKAFFDHRNKVPDGQLSYKPTWFGFCFPEYNGWTPTATGAAFHYLSNGRMIVSTDDGAQFYWELDSGEDTGFASVEFSFQCSAFDTMVSGDVGVEIDLDTGSARYRLGLYFLSAGGLRLRDRIATSTIADIPIDFSTEYTYRVECSNNRFQLWYRPADSSDDQAWERAVVPFMGDTYVGYELTAGSSTAANTSVRFGHFFATTTGATGDADTRWRKVQVNFGDNLASAGKVDGIRKWFTPDYVSYATVDFFHNGYPFTGYPAWITDGTSIVATGGPTYDVDEWTLRVAAQYGVENLMPEVTPKPSLGFESETDDEDVTIAWAVDSGAAEFPGNESFGVYIQGANIRTATLYGTTTTGADVVICDINLVRWNGLTLNTHGGAVQVDDGAGQHYVAYGELVGSYLITSGDPRPRLIVANTEGQLNDDTKQATIYFESDGTETDGIDSNPGNRIVGTAGFFVVHSLPSTRFSAYKLVIPAQSTAEGRFKVGKFLFGPLLVFGRPPSFGSTTELPQDNTLLNVTTAGHSESRVYNSAPRVRQLSWQDNIDQSDLELTEPGYIQFAANTEPVALFSDTARQIYGLVRELNGADELIAYCDAIPFVTNTGELRPERFIYGRLTSSFQESNALGHEGASEVVQVTNVVVTEEK